MVAVTGLYLHVPYCRSICPYCDFNVYVAKHRPPDDALARAMAREMAARSRHCSGPLSSVYFGGGTPSLMPVRWLVQVLHDAQRYFGFTEDCEITLEADPGTVDEEALRALEAAGFNRLSIGWQSSHDNLLRTLGRPHDSAAGAEAYAAARNAGFDNISLDLIFAVPGQTLTHLRQDLEALLALRPEHVSLYALTYHGGTPMARRLAKGAIVRATEALELQMMHIIEDTLGAHGYAHYETSNYAQARRRAVHNSLYWAYGSYLGIGPGAHSFLRLSGTQGARWCNLKHPKAYIEHWAGPPTSNPMTPTPPGATGVDFVEHLTPQNMVLEQMMVGLRRAEGVDLAAVRAPLCSPLQQAFDNAVLISERRGLCRREGERLIPTRLGRELTDSAAGLFIL